MSTKIDKRVSAMMRTIDVMVLIDCVLFRIFDIDHWEHIRFRLYQVSASTQSQLDWSH